VSDAAEPISSATAPLSVPSWFGHGDAVTGTSFLAMTFVGGQELSGGQWQRLAAARATFRDAPLLICDEPSAALDARAEHALFRPLRSRGADRTTVLVSHRLANVRQVDRIYVLHEGRLVEQGSHDELMAAGGRYAELFTLQASGHR